MSFLMYDLLLDENGDLPKTPKLERGANIVAQRLKRRLLLHRGEWLLDRREGVPYVRWRESKPPNIQNIAAFIRALIVDTPGVLSLREFSAEFIPNEHAIKISGRVLVTGGEFLGFDGALGDDENVSAGVAFHTTSGAICD